MATRSWWDRTFRAGRHTKYNKSREIIRWTWICGAFLLLVLVEYLAVQLGYITATTRRRHKLILIALFFVYGLGFYFGWWGRRSKYPPGHCKKCGYNLTGNMSGKCPECGRTIWPYEPR